MPEQPYPVSSDQLAGVVVKVRQGSTEALAALYLVFAGQVAGTAYRILGNRADAEDVLQDVFVGLREALAHYTEQGKLDAWLRRLAARTALMRLRRQQRETSFASSAAPQIRETPENRIVDRLAVADALDRIPETVRTVFVLAELEGFSHQEIAELLGITAGASRTRLHRAWRLIHGLLGKGQR